MAVADRNGLPLTDLRLCVFHKGFDTGGQALADLERPSCGARDLFRTLIGEATAYQLISARVLVIEPKPIVSTELGDEPCEALVIPSLLRSTWVFHVLVEPVLVSDSLDCIAKSDLGLLCELTSSELLETIRC